jgi:hypothetical protein
MNVPGFGYWHFWLVFIGTGVLLVVLAWAGSRRRRLSPKQVEAGGYPAACGRCGYDLTGLPGRICPECGSDLELVGRLSPRFHLWAAVPVTARTIVWTVAIAAFSGAFVYTAIEYALPRRQVFRVVADWSLRAPVPEEILLTDRSDSYSAITVRMDASFARRLWPWDSPYGARYRVQPDRKSRWMAATMELRFYGPPEIADRRGQKYYTHRKAPGEGFVYLDPDESGSARVSEVTEAALEPTFRARLPNELDSTTAIVLALDQAAYSHEHGKADELASDLADQVDGFLSYGGTFPPQTGSVWQSDNATLSSSRWRGGTMMGGDTIRLEPMPVLLASGFWFAVWVAGLPFILRKRPLSIRREETEAEPVGESAALEPPGA